jgi:hypothetical protein
MKRSVIIVALAVTWVTACEAQGRQFPYDAVITQDETYVRSGPGTRYYPTSRLARGTKVTVHRHDPGGWYMIAPPADSFSWIRREYVDRQGDDSGVVTENQVVVRVGTVFGDTRDVEQKRLSRGDRVKILGEKVFTVEGESIAMFKIAPPRGEYRWIPGQFVTDGDSIAGRSEQPPRGETPVGSARTKPRPDPFADTPPESNKPLVRSRGESDRSTAPSESSVARSAPPEPRVSAEHRERLARLDAEFRQVVRAEIPEWDFVKLEEGYRELQESSTEESFQFQLEQRFAALAKYQKIKDQYDEFVRLTEETARRDAEIVKTSGQNLPPIVSPAERTRTPPTPAESRSVGPTPAPAPAEAGSAESASGGEPASDDPPKLAGAGIVSRAVVNFPGAPRHLLLAPDGRMLAFLQPRGNLDLDRYAGHAMGVVGERSHRADLQADVILVDSIVPVRLK